MIKKYLTKKEKTKEFEPYMNTRPISTTSNLYVGFQFIFDLASAMRCVAIFLFGQVS